MFDPWLLQLFSKHAKTGILVDANLLFLYCVGRCDESRISIEKGTREYTRDDFHLLRQVIARFACIVTTPNILTEVDNLSERLTQDVRNDFRELTQLQLLKIINECYIASARASDNVVFRRLGLTDATIGVLADQGILVLTNDFDLAHTLAHRKVGCIHYNSVLRPLVLDLE